MKNRLASCSCGKLSAEVEGDPIRVSVCHCLACQRRTGSVFGAQARFSRESVKIKGHGKDFVRIGDEGTKSTFTFCPECGATVYYVMAGNEDIVAIPVGAFADPAFPGPTFSVYEERMHGWVVMPQDIEHMR
ncbi:GFA family protein [Sorangium cellulosum]|uniref:GFA family protein n=1 Tax=Sorangium cellulosum TaxID=56 RepID=UPI003D9A54E7